MEGDFYLENIITKEEKIVSLHPEVGSGLGWFFIIKSWFQHDWSRNRNFKKNDSYFEIYLKSKLYEATKDDV